ncbi:Tn3 family transposase [Streptomyces vinaceus]|uniref:Tn3 family transposase n=1 Tax=Streptomyces vinaceus TaxID=1960 RepID=UPI0035D74F66
MHADTQGQSFPVFGLAHLLGIDHLPQVRNFQDLTFHRPDPRMRYRHRSPPAPNRHRLASSAVTGPTSCRSRSPSSRAPSPG